MKRLRDLWKHTFDFKGIAATKEFFASLLVNWVAMIVLLPVPILIIILLSMLGIGSDLGMMAVAVISVVYMIVFLIPIPALTVRRMRDSGHPLWRQIIIVLGIPVYGFLLIGVLKPETWTHCFLTKLGRVLLLTGLGGFLWGAALSAISTVAIEYVGMLMLVVFSVGLITGGIGGKMDERRNKIASGSKESEYVIRMSKLSAFKSGRPEGKIHVIRQLSSECSKDGAFYSFEQRTREIDIIENQSLYFVRVTEYNCCAEANGRPVSSHTEHYYTVAVTNINDITANNWKESVTKPAAYVYHQVYEGVI